MNTLRPVVAPVSPLAAGTALSAAAVALHGPTALLRGGPVQRAANLAARGVPIGDAAAVAARQGKGHVAELLQSAEYCVRSGALARPFHARPNPRANDPRVDVELRRGGRSRVAGVQVKVGSKRYVMKALLSGKYDMLVVNTEARAAIALDEGLDLSDRIAYHGSQAGVLSGAECEERAGDTIARVLRDETPLGWMDVALASATAGARAALESVAVGVLGELVHAAWSGSPVDLAGCGKTSVEDRQPDRGVI